MQAVDPLVLSEFANQERWLARLATGEPCPAPDHPRLFRHGMATAARTGSTGVICLHEEADSTATDALAAVDWLRRHKTADVLVWSAIERPDLDRVLLAHGATPGFQPWWMVRSLDHPLPDPASTIEIRRANVGEIAGLYASREIPYLNPELEAPVRSLVRDGSVVRVLLARDGDRIVGQAIVNMTGEFAGLYNLAVHPDARKRGIGSALSIAACDLARDLGARHIGLNATPQGAGVYERLGFRHAGKGQTWLIPAQRMRNPASERDIDIALKLVHGTVEGIDPAAIPATMPNGERPIAFAARSGNAEAARWLLAHGTPAEILPLWQLGLREEALAAMQDPRLREQTTPPMHGTPLHMAIQAGDAELARLLIEAGADLTARDAQFRSTPLGWAEVLGQPEIAQMIRDAGGR